MRIYLFFLFMQLVITNLNAQHVIKGRILSASNNVVLSGASIKIKGTLNVVFTDNNGVFSIISTNTNVALEISFVGYKQKEITVRLPLTKFLEIHLESYTELLDEVIVSTGYQQLPKERATGSFTYVNNETFNQQVGSNVLNRLEAVANGLTVDRQTSVNGGLMIRGLSTIRGPKEPLIILDNFPYDGDPNNINPNDVEGITILKDAAAASIWGARAGNGVIVITTKKGRYNQPLSVDVNSNLTLGGKPDLFYAPQISSSDFIDVETMLYDKGYYTSDINSKSKPALSPVVELLIERKNAGEARVKAIDARINELKNIDVRDQFNKYIYQPAVNQQYALSLRGGSGIMAWTASSGYDKNVNTLDAGYSRLNLHFHNTITPVKNLQLSAGVYYTLSKIYSGKSGYGAITSKNGNIFPYAEFADADGKALPLIRDYRQTYIQTVGNGKLLNWEYYPLEDYKHNQSNGSTQDVIIRSGLNYKIFRGISADINFQYERQQANSNNLQDKESYSTRDLVNRFTQINSAGVVSKKIPQGGILDFSNALLVAYNLRGQLNYNHSWGEHSLNAIAGGERKEARTTQNNNRLYGYNDEILTFGTVDYTASYPLFINGNGFIPSMNSINDNLNRYMSLYANGSYVYNERYTISLSGRRDASNLFGVNTNRKWNPLWSAGFSWIISSESFYNSAFLSYLKFRATHGFSGNTDPRMAGVTTIRYLTTSQYTLTPYSEFDNYYNPELKWETAGITNFGLDFKLKNERLSGSIEYYRKSGKDLFGTYPLDYTAGIGTSIVKNVAAMKGQGWDIELNSLNVNGTIKWTSNINLSFYKDRVTKYYLNSKQGSRFVGTNAISGLEGKPVYSMFAYKWAGLDPNNGEARGYLNGEINNNYTNLTGIDVLVDDLDYHGNIFPTSFGSLGNSISWKNIALTIRVSYKFGHFFRKPTINYNDLYANWRGHPDFVNRWKNPGDEMHTDVPALAYPSSSSLQSFYTGASAFVERADNIRLQYIAVSYQINKKQVPMLPFKSLQLNLNVSNLGILWRANKQRIDPDFISALSIPPSNNIAFGIKANL